MGDGDIMAENNGTTELMKPDTTIATISPII